MVSSNDIRATFLDYFVRNGHERVPSSSLVPRNDPTLLFTNSGMVQFKNVFTGQERRPYATATTAQKCVRAGGKHNDLDNVGYTARHHTFFEMLGNFSFGNYFKPVAIELAWSLLTKDFGIDPAKLLVTVFSEDEEAASLWRKIAGLGDDRIIRIATSDNFWRMGDTGPCGPCSEIFYDHGPGIPGGPPGSPDEDGDRFIEIWNLVFMQYEEAPPGTRTPLPHPSIDTGMGFERFVAVMQGKHNNYDIDMMRALVVASADAAGQDVDGPFQTSHRVVADHLRSTAFLIAEGVLPSKDGRGYVLRRIMRRAMRHLHMMGTRDATFHRLVPALIRQMGAAYPELPRAEALIVETMRLEEERFKAMLDRGLGLLAEETGRLGSGGTLPGSVAFKLYDTFGFPLDLTQDALREQGLAVDVTGFNAAMQEQRVRARAAWAGTGDAATERVWFDVKERVGATEFVGYATETSGAEILAVIVDGQEVESADAGTSVAIVLNQTPFYGESGGQVGDTGVVMGEGFALAIHDTHRRLGDLFVHSGKVESGTVRPGLAATAIVDHDRRRNIRAHHSATHLLHAALRERLGAHVSQRGSLNAPDRLRFDISQPTPIGRDSLALIEAEVNDRVRANTVVTTRLMTPEAAVAEGAMALFGEKYGDEVRVVGMGGPGADGTTLFSVELCGGTHVDRTGDIGLFRITSETAVSAGVRRIEAVTGRAAMAQIAETDRRVSEVAGLLRVAAPDLVDRVGQLVEERRKLERQVGELQRQLAAGSGPGPVEEIAGIKLAVRLLEGVPARDLKGIAESTLKELGSGVTAIISVADGKASVVIGVSADLVPALDAVEITRAASLVLGGKGGGGRADLAQGGGPHAENVASAVETIRSRLSSQKLR